MNCRSPIKLESIHYEEQPCQNRVKTLWGNALSKLAEIPYQNRAKHLWRREQPYQNKVEVERKKERGAESVHQNLSLQFLFFRYFSCFSFCIIPPIFLLVGGEEGGGGGLEWF